jgi:hypothetical protein
VRHYAAGQNDRYPQWIIATSGTARKTPDGHHPGTPHETAATQAGNAGRDSEFDKSSCR